MLLLMAIMVLGCENNANPCALHPEVLEHIHHLDSLIGIPEVRERDRQGMKSNFDEPSIFDAKSETYRFILSSSSGYSKVVRIQENDDHYSAVVKEFNWTFGDWNPTPRVKQFELPEETWDSITSGLDALGFWTYPNPPHHLVLDGASWSLSGFKPTRDKCTSMQFQQLGTSYSPDEPGFTAMCKLFDDLATGPHTPGPP